MELKLLVLAALFLTAIASEAAQFFSSKPCRRSQSSHRKNDSRFDYFLFVQQWPGSYCDTKKGCCFPESGEPGPAFGIHGLWPNRNDGTYPRKCENVQFNPNELEEVMDNMHKSWGTLSCNSRSNEDFWKHEWSKHGTCSGLTQGRYFQASLELYNRFDIAGALRDAGILPDDQHYSIVSIASALTNILGHSPQIVCNQDPRGNLQLHEVRFCVAKDASTLIECPVRSSCRGLMVQFPLYGGVPSRHTVSTLSQTSHAVGTDDTSESEL